MLGATMNVLRSLQIWCNSVRPPNSENYPRQNLPRKKLAGENGLNLLVCTEAPRAPKVGYIRS